MSRTGVRRPKDRSPHSKKQQAILEGLEAAARRAGLTVSTGRLRYAGLKLKGGSCLLKGRRWLIMDRAQPFDDLLEIFRQALSPEELAEAGLSRDGLALTAAERAAASATAPAEPSRPESSSVPGASPSQGR
ncbi:MAG: hypothetical protein LBV70_04085 [Candidatus Adiutrix sp.]|jgi:hypothetical protein|nr:hypothetical protein [Candidatus Adiutrix sp.]